MIVGSLLIANSHGLDLLVSLLVIQQVGIGIESGLGAQTAYGMAGLGGVLALKIIGTGALIVVARLPIPGSRLRTALAAGAGLGAVVVNLISFSFVR